VKKYFVHIRKPIPTVYRSKQEEGRNLLDNEYP